MSLTAELTSSSVSLSPMYLQPKDITKKQKEISPSSWQEVEQVLHDAKGAVKFNTRNERLTKVGTESSSADIYHNSGDAAGSFFS